ncbi:PepSY-associated TM helix domain-containing protein [Trinickia sp. NRRL B-1857]|uniref:PepSY-associated TM helix domain-containing protein n=1 Tax=Trinickia sp. NRRL B-1857 TaxID=3162879 RepID=UPI003D294664
MRTQTLRAYQWLHTWTGIVAGLALFVAFLAGALTMFQDQIGRWERRQAWHVQPSAGDVDRLVAAVLVAHPTAASRLGIMWPSPAMPDPTAFWFERGHWHFAALDRRAASASASASASAGALVPLDTPRLAPFINKLHYALALPPFGMYLMGAVSIAFGFAMVSGLIVHWPRLAKDLFALRPGKNRKRFWQDAHSALGLFPLPFYAMVAVTGAFMCLTTAIAFVFNIAFDHRLSAALPAMWSPSTLAAPGYGELPNAGPLSAEQLLAAARREVPDLEPEWVTFTDYGKSNGRAEVWGDVPKALGTRSAVALRLTSGTVTGSQHAGARDANHAIGSAIYGLHFGTYGGLALRWAYFALGLCGAAMVFTGNLMWLEARRKRDVAMQPLAARNIARLTVGVCVGTCVGLAVAFVGARCLPGVGADRVFCIALALSLGHCVWRAPIFAARDLLMAAAVASASIVIVDVALGAGDWLRSIVQNDGAVFGVDLVAAAAALLFAYGAHIVHRRAKRGATTGVWALHSNETV